MTAVVPTARLDRGGKPRTAPRLAARLLTACGVALVPWMFVLARTLPDATEVSHWATAWVGLDALMAAGLIGTGVLFGRRDPRGALTAAATSALLVTDAWFDVVTAAPGPERITAVTMAVCAELPLAVVCGVLAVRSLRFRRAEPEAS